MWTVEEGRCGSVVSAWVGNGRADFALGWLGGISPPSVTSTLACSTTSTSTFSRASRASAQHGPPSGPAPARLTVHGDGAADSRWQLSRGTRLWGLRRCSRSAIDDRTVSVFRPLLCFNATFHPGLCLSLTPLRCPLWTCIEHAQTEISHFTRFWWEALHIQSLLHLFQYSYPCSPASGSHPPYEMYPPPFDTATLRADKPVFNLPLIITSSVPDGSGDLATLLWTNV